MMGVAMSARQGPMAPRLSQAEDAPGPPLKMKVIGRSGGRLGVSWRKAVVTISAVGRALGVGEFEEFRRMR